MQNQYSFFERKDHLIKKHPDFTRLTPEEQNHLINYFTNRDNTPSLNIDWNRLSKYNIRDILKATYDISKTARKKAVKQFGIHGLKENEDYIELPLPNPRIKAYIPLHYEASKLLASNKVGPCEGKWCTAYQKSDQHWTMYTINGKATLIYIITPSTKYAIAAYMLEQEKKIEVYDANDEKVSIEDLSKILAFNVLRFLYKNWKFLEKIQKSIRKNSEKQFQKYLEGAVPVPDERMLRKIIERVSEYADLSKLDVSQITDMHFLFQDIQFNGDISNWDVSNVTDMSYMFYKSKFNGNISKWDVSNVKDMRYMFANSPFNGDISNWDVSNVEDMRSMFEMSPFNGDISKWNVSNVKDMSGMFMSSLFNGDISKWDVSNVEDMNHMFANSPFNGDISNWDVSNVEDMRYMFANSPFNGDISNWDVSSVKYDNGIFRENPLEERYPNGIEDLKKEKEALYEDNPWFLYKQKDIIAKRIKQFFREMDSSSIASHVPEHIHAVITPGAIITTSEEEHEEN